MATSTRLSPGDVVARRPLATIRGPEVAVPDPGRLVHLQFRRFAGCPVCNLHLREIDRRLGEISAAGIHEVAVFHSSAESLARHATELRLDVVADPGFALYQAYGVESSARAVLDPRAWPALVAGALRGLAGAPSKGETSRSLPADFLLDTDGRVLACKYGAHADDQWSVDELLAIAARHRSGAPLVRSRRRAVAYWLTTVVAAVVFLGSGIANLVGDPHVVDDLARMGYPWYFPTILGSWKVLGSLAILAPRLPRLKEWAYAGMVFDLTGAAASRAFAGAGVVASIIPLWITAIVLVSSMLRPRSRHL
jgi:peroxiredoxin